MFRKRPQPRQRRRGNAIRLTVRPDSSLTEPVQQDWRRSCKPLKSHVFRRTDAGKTAGARIAAKPVCEHQSATAAFVRRSQLGESESSRVTERTVRLRPKLTSAPARSAFALRVIPTRGELRPVTQSLMVALPIGARAFRKAAVIPASRHSSRQWQSARRGLRRCSRARPLASPARTGRRRGSGA